MGEIGYPVSTPGRFSAKSVRNISYSDKHPSLRETLPCRKRSVDGTRFIEGRQERAAMLGQAIL